MPDYIHLDESAIAQPSFRIFAYWPATLAEPTASAELETAFSILLE